MSIPTIEEIKESIKKGVLLYNHEGATVTYNPKNNSYRFVKKDGTVLIKGGANNLDKITENSDIVKYTQRGYRTTLGIELQKRDEERKNRKKKAHEEEEEFTLRNKEEEIEDERRKKPVVVVEEEERKESPKIVMGSSSERLLHMKKANSEIEELKRYENVNFTTGGPATNPEINIAEAEAVIPNPPTSKTSSAFGTGASGTAATTTNAEALPSLPAPSEIHPSYPPPSVSPLHLEVPKEREDIIIKELIEAYLVSDEKFEELLKTDSYLFRSKEFVPKFFAYAKDELPLDSYDDLHRELSNKLNKIEGIMIEAGLDKPSTAPPDEFVHYHSSSSSSSSHKDEEEPLTIHQQEAEINKANHANTAVQLPHIKEREIKYYPFAVLIFFGSLTNYKFNLQLEQDVVDYHYQSKEEIKALCQEVITVYKDKLHLLTSSAKSDGDPWELNELLQLQFHYKKLNTGVSGGTAGLTSFVPKALVKLSDLTSIATMLNPGSSNTDNTQFTPEQIAIARQESGIYPPESSAPLKYVPISGLENQPQISGASIDKISLLRANRQFDDHGKPIIVNTKLTDFVGDDNPPIQFATNMRDPLNRMIPGLRKKMF